MTKKRLLIHAGVHQTGTALIQKMFADNANRVAATGILYPAYEESGPARPASHQRLAWKLYDKKVEPEALKDWATSLTQTEASTIVLSSQDFARLQDLSFLETLTGLFDVEVVFYLRRQDDWVNSWYNLNVKWPFDARFCRCDPIEFLNYLDEFHWIRYFDTTDRWAKRLGRERVHIRVMERGQVEDPVADIRELSGMRPEAESQSPKSFLQEEQLNASLPADQLEMLRRLGTIQYSEAVRTKITNAVSRVSSSATVNVYPREIRQLIIDHYAGQNQKLARLVLGRDDGILFRERGFPQDPAERGTDVRPLYMLIRNIIKEFKTGRHD